MFRCEQLNMMVGVGGMLVIWGDGDDCWRWVVCVYCYVSDDCWTAWYGPARCHLRVLGRGSGRGEGREILAVFGVGLTEAGCCWTSVVGHWVEIW